MKKTFFIWAFCSFALSSYNQTNLQIAVKNSAESKIEKIEIWDLTEQLKEAPYDHVVQVNLDKNEVDQYQLKCIQGESIYSVYLWLNPGSVRIEAHVEGSKMIIDTILNAPAYYESNNIQQTFARLKNAGDTATLRTFLLGKFEQHIDNPLSMYIATLYVMVFQQSKPALQQFKAIADKQGDKFVNHALYFTPFERLKIMLLDDPVKLETYTFTDINNLPAKINLNGSEYYILDFWGITCPPCIRDHQILNEHYPALLEKKITFIALNFTDTHEKLTEYISSHQYQWPNFLDNSEHPIYEDLNISGMPSYLILDKNGNKVGFGHNISGLLNKFEIRK